MIGRDAIRRQTALGRSGRAGHKPARLLRASTAIALLTTPAAFAQEARNGQTIRLEQVTVEDRIENAWGPVEGYVAQRSATGTKTDTPLIETPQSVSVVTADQMEAQNVESIGNALRYTAGVSGEQFGNDLRGFGLQIRGFNVSDEAFYKDGMRLKGTDFASFLAFDPYGAERLEILRGPSSVLYGQNSPGGIINYVSKRPTEETLREIEVSIGSFDRVQGQFDMGGKIDDLGVWTYRLTGLVRDGDTHVDFVEDNRFFIAPALKWQPDADTSLTLLASYQKDNAGWGIQFLPASGTVKANPFGRLPASRFVGEPDFDKYDLTLATIGYEFEHRFDEIWQVRQNLRYAYLANDQEGVFGGGLGADGRSYNRYADEGRSRLGNFGVDNQVQADFDTGPVAHKLLMGVDYQYSDYSDWATYADVDPIDIFDPVYGRPLPPLDVYQDTNSTQSQIGIYAQDQMKLGNWALTLGGRHDWTKSETEDRLGGGTSEQSDDAFTGRAGLVYLSEIGFAPYVSYSTSFLPELGTDSNGDPFKPTTGEQYEVGVKYQPQGWNSFVTLAAFDLTKENVVRYFGNDSLQTGEIRSRGIEVEGVASFDAGLDVRLAYTYLDTRIRDDSEGNEGNVPYGVPRHHASLWADYTIPTGALEGLGFGAGIRYVGSSYGDDANSFEVPAVTLVDAAIHYDWRDFQFKLAASNLFDKEYVASCFSETSGCFFGETRKITGSVKYRW